MEFKIDDAVKCVCEKYKGKMARIINVMHHKNNPVYICVVEGESREVLLYSGEVECLKSNS